MRSVYITGTGSFLPGPPLEHDDLEPILGLIAGQPSKYRSRVLRANGIKTRHYARNREGQQTHVNEELAVNAIRDALVHRGASVNDVEMLAVGTTWGDVFVPGFASMVHGRLGGRPMEVLSSAGVCVSGMNAFRAVYNAVRAGDHDLGVTGASELVSCMMTGSRFKKESEIKIREDADPSFHFFNADFLRWMLSDGAGAAVLESKPHPTALSLRVDWVTSTSYAHKYPVCMYAGTSDTSGAVIGKTVSSYSSFAAAEEDGLGILRQDTKLLGVGIPDVVGTELKRLMGEKQFTLNDVDWVLPHLSSMHFRAEMLRVITDLGRDESMVFTNLRTKGNTGSASIYIMLDEALKSGMFKPGERILLMIPESARFSISYAMLTCVSPDAERTEVSLPPSVTAQSGEPVMIPKTKPSFAPVSVAPHSSYARALTESEIASALERSPLGLEFARSKNPVSQYLARELALVWQEFTERLTSTPFFLALEHKTLTVDDYKCLLRNLRQQVVDGARWISRAASNISQENFFVRSAMITHSAEEHRDFQMLERNYMALGGTRQEIEHGNKNVGSEALSAFVFQEASMPDPLQLLGAMFIIEGLGSHFAGDWAKRIKEQLGLDDKAVSFLAYHGENDDNHYDKLRAILSLPIITQPIAERLVKTAKTVARLYGASDRGARQRMRKSAGQKPPELPRHSRPSLVPEVSPQTRSAIVTATPAAEQIAEPKKPRDRANPSIYHALRVSPTVQMEREGVEVQVRDLQNWTRWYIFPAMRLLALGITRLIFGIKRLIPLRLHSERALNFFTKWATRYLASKDALTFMLRHFVIETQIINFIARNSGDDAVETCDLIPLRPEEMGDWKVETQSFSTTSTFSISLSI
ncbi:MAG: 3-oxoacyl-[acyl-carrier-protein] synthase III C-terminal domain-containing protein [Polyangiales bacterium]